MSMDPTKPSRLGSTRIFLAGTKVNLADPETIKWLKASRITKVFCLYPLKQKQFTELKKNVREVFPTMQKLYKAWGINPLVVTKLGQAGIRAVSLVRNPNKLREYDSFVKEAIRPNTKHNFMIQCYAGLHASAAYAMYYLAVATPMTYKQIVEQFVRSGRGKDIGRVEDFLRSAKVYIRRIIERKERNLALAGVSGQIRRVGEMKRKGIKTKKRKRPKIRRRKKARRRRRK